jgi:hypothetical protein
LFNDRKSSDRVRNLIFTSQCFALGDSYEMLEMQFWIVSLMTNDNSPITVHLKDLGQDRPERPGWSVTFGMTCADAAAVCLDDQEHPQPVTLPIEGIQA